MTRKIPKDQQWDRIKDMLPGKASNPGSTANNRLFVEAVLWIARTGLPWRDLPEELIEAIHTTVLIVGAR